jgi:Resolvase, N terminal domain
MARCTENSPFEHARLRLNSLSGLRRGKLCTGKDLFSHTRKPTSKLKGVGIMKRAAIYLRVSTVDQRTSNQEQELRQAAERAGWEVVEVYTDHGISGAKGRDKRQPSTLCAEMPAAAGLTSSWPGALIAWAEAFRT